MANKINARLNKVLRALDDKKISKVAYDEFKNNTPERTGNAKRKTKLQGTTINADYPYADRLDNGYSKQSPDGMTEPTIEAIRNYVYQQTGVKI